MIPAPRHSVLTLDRLRLALTRNATTARKERPAAEPWGKVLDSATKPEVSLVR